MTSHIISGLIACDDGLKALRLPMAYAIGDLYSYVRAAKVRSEDELQDVYAHDDKNAINHCQADIDAYGRWLSSGDMTCQSDPNLLLRHHLQPWRVEEHNFKTYLQALVARTESTKDVNFELDFLLNTKDNRAVLYSTLRIVAQHSGPYMLGEHVPQVRLDNLVARETLQTALKMRF